MRLTSRERVEGAIHLLGDGEVLRADVQGPCTLDLRLGGEIPRWRSTVARSCSNSCSNTADFADVRECSPVSRSLVALRIRSLANGGEHAAQDWGSRGRRLDLSPRPSAPPGHARHVESPPHRSLGPPGLFGQFPQRPAALVLGSYELDKPPSLSRCLAHRRGAAELRQHLKYRPGWIRHDAILRDTGRSPKALAFLRERVRSIACASCPARNRSDQPRSFDPVAT